MQLTTRNAELADLAAMLKDQQAAKLDVVAPAASLRSRNGVLYVEGTSLDFSGGEPVAAAGAFVPTAVFDEGVADKLGIPLAYVRRMREHRPDLYDDNVNGWLHGHRLGEGAALVGGEPHDYPADTRKFLARLFRGDGDTGIARALLSDTYKRMDNLDTLMAALEGVKDAGVNASIDGCDLTERNMYVRLSAPEVSALAPTLLAGYRSPFNGTGPQRSGWTQAHQERHAQRRSAMQDRYGRQVGDVVWAGLELRNSETGGGAFSITPRITVLACLNGQTITKDALRKVHLGARMDAGIVEWSNDTEEKNLALVKAQARDAVATFLNVQYLQGVIDRIEQQAGRQLEKPAEAIKVLASALKFTQGEADGILDHFIRGGQPTAGGVLNAVTSFAQTVADADRAAEIEGQGLRALELAAS